jgi:hypothetical protein
MKTKQHNTSRREPDDLNLSDAARGVVVPTCERLGLTYTYLKSQHLHAVMLDMVALNANGASDAELMAYGLALLDLARTLKSQQPTDPKVSERMLVDADCAEDHLRNVIHIEGESPSTLEAHAAMLERQAHTSIAHARVQRKKARQIRSTRATARARFGLGGVA